MISIKDVCQLLGITPTAIRKYEKYLPESPWRITENGYRGFGVEDLAYLYDCRSMIKYGLSVETAFNASDGADITRKLGLLSDRKAEIEEEIQRLELVKEAIEEEARVMANLPSLINSYEIREIPEFYYFKYDWNTDLQDLMSSWARAFPFVRYAPRFSTRGGGLASSPDSSGLQLGLLCKPRWSSMVEVNHPAVSYTPAAMGLGTALLLDRTNNPLEANVIDHTIYYDSDAYNLFIEKIRGYFDDEGYEMPEYLYAVLLYASGPGSADEAKGPCSYYYVWGEITNPISPDKKIL